MTDRAGRTRVVAHDSGAGAWRMAFLAPTARMAPFICRFNAYAEHDTRFVRRRELPNGQATLIFNLGAELRIEHPAATRSRFAAGAGFYSGPSAAYAVSETEGAQAGAQLMLTLLGARRLIGRPLSDIGDRLTEPADLLGHAARDLLGRLMEAPSLERRLALLEEEMVRRLAAPGTVPRDLAWAWRRLQESEGRLRVGALAGELGCSRKHLTLRFHREFGLPPKLFARLLRFDHAMRLIAADRPASWAALADACGYADQAHMARDFAAFAGSPPAALLRRRLPDEGGFVD